MSLPDKITIISNDLETRIYAAEDVINQLIDYLKEKENPAESEPEDYSIEAFNRFLDADPIADLDKLTIRRKK